MAKCNLLGRGEARYSKKLDKAKEKINKLKVTKHMMCFLVDNLITTRSSLWIINC